MNISDISNERLGPFIWLPNVRNLILTLPSMSVGKCWVTNRVTISRQSDTKPVSGASLLVSSNSKLACTYHKNDDLRQRMDKKHGLGAFTYNLPVIVFIFLCEISLMKKIPVDTKWNFVCLANCVFSESASKILPQLHLKNANWNKCSAKNHLHRISALIIHRLTHTHTHTYTTVVCQAP